MARKEQLLAALDIKSEEEKKLKKLQEDIHAQNTILFDMQVQVKEVIFNNSRGFLHAIFRWSLICTSKFVQAKENAIPVKPPQKQVREKPRHNSPIYDECQTQ